MIFERFSHSGIQSYKKCQAQFKFRYIDKIYKKDEGVEAFLGKRVHESIEYLYNQVISGVVPLVDEILKVHRSLWKEKWHDRVAIVYQNKTARDYFYLGEECIARFYRQNHPFKEKVIANEHEMVFLLDNDENYRIKGIVDRIDHDGDGNWEIHDYKTGKRALSQKAADKDHQLALYQIGLMSEIDNIKSVKLVWHFIQHGIKVESTRTSEDIKKVIAETKSSIDDIREKVKNGGEFPPKTTMLCNWCYYWEECPAQHGTNPNII
ncbi:MAG: PD-(D/E)XK nuclease family protein [Candidatus Marinimicrobia bacterium]|jgi:putative RecB family exonuclease|nr:PD-(D/E)XK nuclease family protein [Candidatus Neomarinimicrobiota bacterium]MBT3944957.1 PD-(D/E)XK nuclease family protein [Candidatus Neomarinimicrobiota bacterium]MBT4154966.1 PD-(D/E)XK nuclease family protein [Candidatus Neomarinimicrobiota bacterium]MBT4554069.1 PD-(D/E)XK nuclease family protein [Candidatus Neomarinimicrobiota bacterium]MBT4753728.1 PD-(D/E)XK nuclease family protein [Candidatus Neomarinimicrobiota bacterium]|tara:strand:+ start:17985 stop:18779 length:795 start_codon:yes stop_codon:yes gene_type:complete